MCTGDRLVKTAKDRYGLSESEQSLDMEIVDSHQHIRLHIGTVGTIGTTVRKFKPFFAPVLLALVNKGRKARET